jgi:hypothetical protein
MIALTFQVLHLKLLVARMIAIASASPPMADEFTPVPTR